MAKKVIKKSKKAAQKAAPSLANRLEKVIQEYDRAVKLLHQQHYDQAADGFRTIITEHGHEKEITDRCRVFLNFCERHQGEKVQPLKRAEDYYYQGIMESNRQQYDQAIEHLERAHKMEPSEDRYVYCLASTLALKGERDLALARLRDAINLNAVNRAFAQQDSDFDTFREDESFIELVYQKESASI